MFIRIQQSVIPRLSVFVFAAAVLFSLTACDRSKPTRSEITEYIETYQMVNDYRVKSMNYEIAPNEDNQSGLIRVTGQLELSETLYEEDPLTQGFRAKVIKQMRQNGFTEREIKHGIYDRVIRASTRVPKTENQFYAFLEKRHDPGLAINFAADLSYRKSDGDMLLDGRVGHARIKGKPLQGYAHPIVDDSEMVQRTLETVLAERDRYQDLMWQSKGVLRQLWDNDYGFVLWNRKVPKIALDDLSEFERRQLAQLSGWQGIYHISNVKPVVFKEARAAQFFELGYYDTTGIATCLKQTGFINQLRFAKGDTDKYCELGRQYPVYIRLGMRLNEQNIFYISATFRVNEESSPEYWHDAKEFKAEVSEFTKYHDQHRLEFLPETFDVTDYRQPVLVDDDTSPAAAAKWQVLNYGRQLAATNSLLPKVSMPESDGGASMNAGMPVKMSQSQLVKAIQVELQRLNIYRSSIDGVAGKGTVWSINYFQKQRGLALTGTPSEELLMVLRATPADLIAAPRPAPKNTNKDKETVVGKMAKSTGRALGKAADWIGDKFKKKDD